MAESGIAAWNALVSLPSSRCGHMNGLSKAGIVSGGYVIAYRGLCGGRCEGV